MTSVSTHTGQDKHSFGALVVKRLRDKGWTGTAEFSPAQFSIGLGQDKPVLYLDNTYVDWLSANSDAEKIQVIDRLVKVALTVGTALDEIAFETAAPVGLPARPLSPAGRVPGDRQALTGWGFHVFKNMTDPGPVRTFMRNKRQA